MVNTIYEVRLEHDYGYCLVSVLSFSGYGMGGLHAVKPLDWISKYPIELEKKELEIIDEVAAPVLCLSKPPIRGPLKWRCMHEFEDGQSLVLPLCMNDPTQAARVTMDWNLIDWEAIHGLQRDKINCHEFGQVAHLPNWTMGNIKYALEYLTMLWMRMKGEDIRKRYDTECVNSGTQFLYKLVMNIRLYSEIAKDERNMILLPSTSSG